MLKKGFQIKANEFGIHSATSLDHRKNTNMQKYRLGHRKGGFKGKWKNTGSIFRACFISREHFHSPCFLNTFTVYFLDTECAQFQEGKHRTPPISAARPVSSIGGYFAQANANIGA